LKVATETSVIANFAFGNCCATCSVASPSRKPAEMTMLKPALASEAMFGR
jgi:hypothetical protein